jgi:hypothetical protein
VFFGRNFAHKFRLFSSKIFRSKWRFQKCPPALHRRARHVRVALESDGARADGLVGDARALGVAAAGQVVGAADWRALAAAAGMRLLALAVGLAPNLFETERF